ncbi:hypothetical protein ACFC58_09080 [Kitasatospora purpeofusca]|uniref:hypothetical protein n=1 Tax=Kitasatospora purpeofusca TaxID=67352 RepID=UPI0035DB57F2
MPVIEGAIMVAVVKGGQAAIAHLQKELRAYYTEHPEKLAVHIKAAKKGGGWIARTILEVVGAEWVKEALPFLFPPGRD